MQNHQSLEDELHVTCGKIPRDDHRTICGLCGCKNSSIDTSKLDLSGHVAVNQVRFGKDSLKDSDYQAVLGMLPEDIVTDFCCYFVQECSIGRGSHYSRGASATS